MLALVGGLVLNARSSTGETLVCSAAVRNLDRQVDKDDLIRITRALILWFFVSCSLRL